MAFQLHKVLITDKVDPKCVDILKANGIEVEFNTALAKDKAALLAEIPKYDGLIVRSATKVTADVIEAAKSLKIIGRAGTGVDNIDCDAATRHGVIVMNTPGGNTLSAAEHTCTLIMATSRHVANGTESLRAGKWERSKFMGSEVYGKTLGIVGLGRIGREVALRMQAFGMTTIGYDPIITPEQSAEFNCEWMPLEKLWPLVDYVTVHTPLIPQTKNLISDEVFAVCKNGLRVINCARGGIVDESALLRALNAGQCGGAGLDVFVSEPPTDLDLVRHPLVVSTPHLGASTTEAQSRVAEEIAQQFVDMTQGKSLFGAINAQALVNALSPSTMPYVDLGKALGKVGAVLLGEVDNKVQVHLTTQGDRLKGSGAYLGAAVLVGLLKTHSQNGLNLVSSPVHARDLGLKSTCEHNDSGQDSEELVTVVFCQEGGSSYTVTGEVAAGRPLLVSINGAKFSQRAGLFGNNLLYRSQADPTNLGAVIGALTAADTVVQSFVTSSAVDGYTWSVMQVAPPVPSIAALELPVDFAKQFEI